MRSTLGNTGRGLLKTLLRPLVCWRAAGADVHLTFDDGPSQVGTRLILDALDAARIKATFFLTGSEILKHPELAEEVRTRGHRIGSHGFEHRHVDDMSWREQLADLRRMRELSKSRNLGITCYRPPYGELSVLRLLWCAFSGIRVVMWSLDSGDSHAGAAENVARRITPQSVGAGEIILFHDDSAVTAERLPAVLDVLRQSGRTFGTSF